MIEITKCDNFCSVLTKLNLYRILKKHGDVDPAFQFILNVNARGSRNINDALLKAINLAIQVKEIKEIDEDTQQMIVFLTDGPPTVGETFGPKIRENVKRANQKIKIPIYGLAFGDSADFDVIKGISADNNGIAERIYESGSSFEQLEDFINRISGMDFKKICCLLF